MGNPTFPERTPKVPVPLDELLARENAEVANTPVAEAVTPVSIPEPAKVLAESSVIAPAVLKPERQPQVPQQPPVKQWKFVKNFSVADEIVFSKLPGDSFQFRLIPRADQGGYHTNSFVVTSDEKLADKLRQAARNKAYGIVEVSV